MNTPIIIRANDQWYYEWENEKRVAKRLAIAYTNSIAPGWQYILFLGELEDVEIKVQKRAFQLSKGNIDECVGIITVHPQADMKILQEVMHMEGGQEHQIAALHHWVLVDVALVPSGCPRTFPASPLSGHVYIHPLDVYRHMQEEISPQLAALALTLLKFLGANSDYTELTNLIRTRLLLNLPSPKTGSM